MSAIGCGSGWVHIPGMQKRIDEQLQQLHMNEWMNVCTGLLLKYNWLMWGRNLINLINNLIYYFSLINN